MLANEDSVNKNATSNVNIGVNISVSDENEINGDLNESFHNGDKKYDNNNADSTNNTL